MPNRDHVKKALAYLEAKVGAKGTVEMTRGNHVRIAWEKDGRRFTVVTSGSPSDVRTALNTCRDIRRAMERKSEKEK